MLVFLVASIGIVSTLQMLFFENERLHLLDQRLETIASSLMASGLSFSLIENLESTDDLINDLLGEERVDYLINIYSLEGDVLAQNYSASEIPIPFSNTDQRVTAEAGGHRVRILNLPRGRLVIQVGVIMGPEIWSGRSLFSERFFWFTILVFIILIIAAYFSSAVLFKPLKSLTSELQTMSSQLDKHMGLPLFGFVIGPQLAQLSKRGRDRRDEFAALCAEIETFLKKLEGYTRTFHVQMAILTHELKTPLAVMKNYLEELARARDLVKAQEQGRGAMEEIDRLSGLINDYLRWSMLTANPEKPADIYAVKLSETLGKVAASLNPLNNQRIQIEVQEELTIFALPEHVEQLVSNLLSNALKYSPADRPVSCVISAQGLLVADKGRGLPREVLQNLGSPFNRGDQKSPSFHQSSGLGLAWVFGLCEKYKWKLDVQSDAEGTKISVKFD